MKVENEYDSGWVIEIWYCNYDIIMSIIVFYRIYVVFKFLKGYY